MKILEGAMEDAMEVTRDLDLVRGKYKFGEELSPTSYLRECCEIFRGVTNQNLHITFLEVYMNFIKARKSFQEVYMDFIKARKSLNSDEIKIEKSEPLSCYVQGDSELKPNNR